jgi:S-adenosylmethionine-diacylgycerolhomoserine-N-methlytransferase
MSQLAWGDDAVRMDRHYRYQRFIYDSTRTHYLIGRKYLIEDLKPQHNDRVLEVGCGTAWNLARIAKRYPHARLFGADISNAMLATAKASLRRQQLEHRVTLRQGDAANFDPVPLFGEKVFDKIVFSYALSMIPCWREALGHAADMLSIGGSIHIVDFGQCERLPLAFKLAFFSFLEHYTVHPRADMENEMSRVASGGLRVTFQRFHRGYTDYAVLTRT